MSDSESSGTETHSICNTINKNPFTNFLDDDLLMVNNDIKNNSESDDENLFAEHKNKIPWVEKYRPQKLDEIIDQTEVIKVLSDTLKTGELPHLLFHGPPGTGKTSTILALAHQLFGPEKIEERVIELNASDDRGIGIVRNNIITFTKIAIGSSDPNYPCPPYKIVILDEADAMTPEAQSALRKVMETKSRITRFCFICNYLNQIIEPITSRCVPFNFRPIDRTSIINKLIEIAEFEKIKIDKSCIKSIVDMSEGDVRKSIMNLQNLKYIIKYKQTITVDDVIKYTNGFDDHEFDHLWSSCINGNVKSIRQLTKHICREGYPVKSILSNLHTRINKSKMNDIQKSTISLELCQTDKRLIDGADEYLQILNILLYINRVFKN